MIQSEQTTRSQTTHVCEFGRCSVQPRLHNSLSSSTTTARVHGIDLVYTIHVFINSTGLDAPLCAQHPARTHVLLCCR